MIKYVSLFSGIGGFDLSFDNAGMICQAQVEFDEKASSVLAYHWPNVKRFKDVRDVGKHNLPAFDVLCGGFPCQDLSVAGRRAGLDGKRSGLWFEFYRIIQETLPRWVVIENVPGLLSSNGGRDFAIILSGLVKCGYCVCYRIFDSQYFGVPQRRRRVFIVASLGNGSCAQILFEQQGGTGDFKPGKKTRQGTARTIGNGFKNHRYTRFGEYTEDNQSSTLRSEAGGQAYDLITIGALQARDYKGVGNQYVAENKLVVMALGHTQSNGLGIYEQDVANTLEGVGSANQAVMLNTVGTLAASGAGTSRPAGQGNELDFLVPIAFQWYAGAGRGMGIGHDISHTLQVSDHTPHAVQGNMGVRRLTPLETERLQGFPDHWTAVNGQADSSRYKQTGNAVTVNVTEWIGRRIVQTIWDEMRGINQ